MVVRELLARLGFTVDKSSANKAEQAITSLKRSASALVALFATGWAAKAFLGMIQQTALLGEKIDDTTKKIGDSAEAIQTLGYAAQLSGSSQDELVLGLKILARNAFQASKGSKEASETFAGLGVNVKDASGKLKPTTVLFTEISDAIKNMKNGTERAAYAQLAFGKSGANLLPFLMEGSKSIERMRIEAHELGGVLDDELIASSAEYRDTQDKLKFAMQGIKNLIAKEMIPIFNRMANRTINWIKANREWLKLNIPFYIERTVRWFKVMSTAIYDAGAAISKFITNLGPGGKFILGMAVALGVLAAAWFMPTFGLALFIFLLGVVIDDIQTFLRGGDSLIGRILANIKALVSEFINSPIDPDAHPILALLQNAALGIIALKRDWGGFMEYMAADFEARGILRPLFEEPIRFWKEQLSNILEEPIRFWKEQIKVFMQWMAEQITHAPINIVKSAFKVATELPGAVAGVARASAGMVSDVNRNLNVSSPAAANVARSLTIQNETSVVVTPSAGSPPQAVGDEVAKKVSEAQERQNRQIVQTFGVAGATN